MKRFFSILLLFCMCVSLVACDIQPVDDASTPPVTEEPLVAPKDDANIRQYLKDKYGKDFKHVGNAGDAEVYYYQTEDFPKPVTVYSLNALWLANYDMTVFTEPYADNGYIYAGYNEIYRYFWQYVEILPQASMLMDLKTKVLPSAVSTEHTFAKNVLNFGEYFHPIIYILTENEVPSHSVRDMKEAFERNNIHVTVIFVTTPKSTWNDMTLEKLENTMAYPHSQTFTTLEDSGE